MVIELDGKIHDYQKEYDEQRDMVIKELNLNVLRILNSELKEPKAVLDKISKAINF